MKKIVIICALLISAVSFAKAQQDSVQSQPGMAARSRQGTPEERAQATLNAPAIASLNLTDAQKAKVLPILIAYNEAMARAQAGSGDMQAVMAEMRTKAADSEKKCVGLLTPDQKKTYNAALAFAKQNNPNAATVIVGRGGG
jgi:hypothetical protein